MKRIRKDCLKNMIAEPMAMWDEKSEQGEPCDSRSINLAKQNSAQQKKDSALSWGVGFGAGSYVKKAQNRKLTEAATANRKSLVVAGPNYNSDNESKAQEGLSDSGNRRQRVREEVNREAKNWQQ